MVEVATVLLIDEHQHMIDLLRGKFELEGFEVLAASTAQEGLELALGGAPDLIVLDERLQDGEGVALAERFREREELREIPMILLTPRASDGSSEDGVSSLQLPFRPSQLVALARENL